MSLSSQTVPDLHRQYNCQRSNSYPKVVEHFSTAEVCGQKLTAGWVGAYLRTGIQSE